MKNALLIAIVLLCASVAYSLPKVFAFNGAGISAPTGAGGGPDPTFPLYTFDAEVNPATNCLDEDGITTLAVGSATFNCDQQTVVLGGTDTLSITGSTSSGDNILAQNAFASQTSGVFLTRFDFRMGTYNSAFLRGSIMRTQNVAGVSGFMVQYTGSTRELRLVCANLSFSDTTGNFVTVGQDYSIAVEYDIDTDTANLWASTTLGDYDTTGAALLTCDGPDAPGVTINGARFYGMPTDVYYLDDVAFGPKPETPPAVPSGLAAGTPTSSTVVLTWDDNDDGGTTDEYIVQYQCPLDAPSMWTQWSSGITGLTTTISGLTASTDCEARIAAEDVLDNRSAFSTPVVDFTTAETPSIHVMDDITQLALGISKSDMISTDGGVTWVTDCTVEETVPDDDSNGARVGGDGCFGDDNNDTGDGTSAGTARDGWGFQWSPATDLVKGETLIVEFEYQKPTGQPYAPAETGTAIDPPFGPATASSPDGSTKFFRYETKQSTDNPLWDDDGSQTDPDVDGDVRYLNAGFFDFKEAYTDADYDTPTNNSYGSVLGSTGFEAGTRFLFTKESTIGSTISNHITATEMAIGTWYHIRIEVDLSDVVSEAEARVWINTDGDFSGSPTMVTEGDMPTLTSATDVVPRILIRSYYNDLAAADMTQWFRNMSWSSEITAPPAPIAYRTIVVFGDNQYQSRDCADNPWPSANERCDDWDQTLTWIANNKVAENIDAVLFVGDLIDYGTKGIHMAQATPTACDGTVTSESACDALGGSYASCEAAGSGCFAFGYPTIEDCHSCTEAATTITNEWNAFDLGADRLATGDVSLPWASTRGNHDDALNWNSRYDDTYWESIDNGTTYDYLSGETFSSSQGDGHAWIMTLGTQEIIVVAMPADDLGTGPMNYTVAAEAWAKGVFDNHPTLPGFLLAHWYGRSEWPAFASEIPNLFAVATGHVYSDVMLDLVDGPGTDDIIRIGNDFTSAAGNFPRDTNGVQQNDYVTLLRWYPDTDEIEAQYYSAVGDAFLDTTTVDAGNATYWTTTGRSGEIAKQTFDIMPPGIYPAMVNHEARLVTLYDDSPSASRPVEPAPPTGLPGTPTAVTTCGDLTTALAGSNQWITVSTAITGCSFQFTGEDVLLEMTNSGSITTSAALFSNGNGAHRLKVTGGAVVSTATSLNGFSNGSDILFKNTKLDFYGFETRDNLCTADCLARVWIVDSDITTVAQAWLMADDSTAGSWAFEDIVLAGNDIISVTEEDNILYGFRMQDVERLLFIDNRMEMRGGNSVLRIMADSRYQLVAGNTFITGNYGTPPSDYESSPLWHQIYAGNTTNAPDGPSDHDGNLQWVHVVENTYISTSGTDHSGSSAYSDDSVDGVSTCANVLLTDNDVFTVSGDVFSGFAGAGTRTLCSPMTQGNDAGANNTSANWSAYSTYPTMPTCGDLGDTCGADH